MSVSLSRWLITISTALLIVITYVMIMLTSPSVLVGIDASEPIELVVEKSSSGDCEALTAIDLNTASVDDLTVLPDLGEVLARRIVAYRNEHGHFSTVDELMNIEGIGDGRLSRWRPYLTVG